MAKPKPGKECIIEVTEAWVSILKEKIEDASENRRARECTISRVPLNIRELSKDAYEAKIISLGPYHRCKPRLQAMNKRKLEFLRKLLRRKAHVPLETYISKLRTLEKQARSSYSEAIGMESNKFVEMMLLDVCFVVELFLSQKDGAKSADKRANKEDDHDRGLDDWDLYNLKRDMLLLENQLPFFVLESIVELAAVGNEQQSYSLTDLAFDFFKEWPPHAMTMPFKEEESVPRFDHLLHFLHSCITRARSQQQQDVPSDTGTLEAIPSAKLLDKAGVKFRGTKGESFLDVTFVDGVLSIPELRIDDDTNSLFCNLIAFEQRFPDVGTDIVAYSYFMDCIIDASEDVDLLHNEGVIVSRLGSSKEAASLFNKIGEEVIIKKGYLSHVLKDVNKHCASRCNRYRRKLMLDYFNSPWSIISLMAAVALLLFTAIQTAFAVLSYIKMPI